MTERMSRRYNSYENRVRLREKLDALKAENPHMGATEAARIAGCDPTTVHKHWADPHYGLGVTGSRQRIDKPNPFAPRRTVHQTCQRIVYTPFVGAAECGEPTGGRNYCPACAQALQAVPNGTRYKSQFGAIL